VRCREKQLKEWRRLWKIRLIENMNPEWLDLFDERTGEVHDGPADVSRIGRSPSDRAGVPAYPRSLAALASGAGMRWSKPLPHP
jgi:hypothetical protein